MNFANTVAYLRSLEAAPAPAPTPAPATIAKDNRTAAEKASDSAKYLKEDVPSIGKPTWNYWDGQGKYANITGADGKEYVFIPDDYVKKGLVTGDGYQQYTKQFLDPATFKNAVQYSLPQGMQSVMNPNGYVWSVNDWQNLKLNQASEYKIDANNPPILGLGSPHPSMQAGSPVSYITQPKLAPGGERVQQDWITSDGRQGGLGQYAYYKYQGPFADAARGALKELGPLTPILLDVFAGPGTGAIYTMSKAAGDASYTGDWNKAATTIGTVLAAPHVSGAVSGVVGSALDMGTLANGIIGNAVGNAAVAGLTGGDPVAAMVNSGVGGAVGAITGKIDGFGDLPPNVQRVFNATLRAELTGKDPSKAAILAATTAGLQAIKNGMEANTKFQNNYGRDATPEELNNFAFAQNENELNSSFEKYMADTTAKSQAEAQESARQAAIDEQNRLDAAEVERKANDEAERLRLAGLEEKKEVDLNKVVTGGDTTDEDAEQAKRVAEFGKDLTGGGKQDLGEVDVNTPIYDKDSTGMGAYKYDPTSGTYTYTSDDGSTLTLDGDGNIVGSTESTDTSWTGLTDTATGNLKLPKLPGGKMPVVKPPTQRVTTTKPITTPTGTGNTAVPTGGNAAAQPGGGLNIPAFLAIMSGLNQPQQQVQQTQEPAQDFQYFDWSADPFASKTKDKTNPTTQPKMAGGGSVDELLEILRRSGI